MRVGGVKIVCIYDRDSRFSSLERQLLVTFVALHLGLAISRFSLSVRRLSGRGMSGRGQRACLCKAGIQCCCRHRVLVSKPLRLSFLGLPRRT
ncbi:hypothetical protein HYQ46_008694 [Verticillium longisporum]|nr:hypothetical protein HYQ46_008694 [Verticillium longisporum]